MDLVRSILAHPAIWPHIHEDGTEAPDPLDHESVHWMLVEPDKPLGVFLLHAHGQVCWEVHTCLLPACWGPAAASAARALGAYVFDQLGAQKLITRVPAYNRPALRFAKASGFRVEGVNRASYLRNGEAIDQIMHGITLKEWTCQQQSQQQPQ